MSLTFRETLASLALGQALMVVPTLGEGYQGKTAATIAAMLLMLAADVETIADRRSQSRDRLAAFLGDAEVGDPSLALDIRMMLRPDTSPSLDERYWNLLALFGLVHEWADDHSPALARACRELLAEWAESERLAAPVIPLG